MKLSAVPLAVLGLLVFACSGNNGSLKRPEKAPEGAKKKEGKKMSLTITSSAFKHMGDIPVLYTAQGKDISPPLSWSNVPEGTKSLALIVDDPDAPDPRNPRTVWVHWVLFNIPPTAKGLPEGVSSKDLPEGTKEGLNDWGRTGYGGPNPPRGKHRYFFKLYALDTVLEGLERPTKAKLLEAMKGHIIAQAELVGLYRK